MFFFLNQTFVLGTQKNHLNEMVLLSTQTTCLKLKSNKLINYNFTLKTSLSVSMICIYDTCIDKQACRHTIPPMASCKAWANRYGSVGLKLFFFH